MFDWLFGNRTKELERKTQEGFVSVKRDMDILGKWIKHLDSKDKQVFDVLNELKHELSSMRNDLEGLREGVGLATEEKKSKQVFRKTGVFYRQTAVEPVEIPVQTGVQTGSFYEILKNLTANERLVIFTLLSSDMKLSYEDLALLLGKERATIRGQINAIKQKSEGLIEELVEKNGKKRVFIPEEVRIKLQKYAKVRVSKAKKMEESAQTEKKSESSTYQNEK